MVSSARDAYQQGQPLMQADPIASTLCAAGITDPADQADADAYMMRSPVVYASAIKAAVKGDAKPLRELADTYVNRTTPDAAYLSSKGISSYISTDGQRMALVKGQHVRVSSRSLRVPMPDCLHREPLRDAVAMPLTDGTPVFELEQPSK